MAESGGIYARESTYLDRYVQLGIAQGRVLSVDFPTSPNPDAESEHELLDRIENYLEGQRDDFEDVTVAMTMPTPQREVLEKVRTIPYSEEVTLEQLARMVPDMDGSDEDDVREIRQALADTPAPLFIPTHRVRDGPSGLPASVDQKLRSVEDL